LKADIRSRFDLDKDSCHISDTGDETRAIAGMLLSSAPHVYDAIPLAPGFPVLDRSLKLLDDFIDANNLDRDDFCIGGSALLALLGHRDCKDLDLLLARDSGHVALPEGLSSHASQAAFYPAPLEEIIHDPGLHFMFLGFKFARPEVILQFKRNRNEI